MRLTAPLIACCLAAPATAQTALPCDWQAQADNIVEPWEDHSATYANGNVRVALLGVADGLGYASINFDDLQASYDAHAGLKLTVPAAIYQPEKNQSDDVVLLVSIKQATGDVTVSTAL